MLFSMWWDGRQDRPRGRGYEHSSSATGSRSPDASDVPDLEENGLCGCELEEFRNALGTGVGLEAGEQVVDELYAAGCPDATGQQ